MTSGTLYLIPNRISLTADVGSLAPEALAAARGCRRFLAENARSARAFLKSISHPGPIAELEIIEIGHDPGNTGAADDRPLLNSAHSDGKRHERTTFPFFGLPAD